MSQQTQNAFQEIEVEEFDPQSHPEQVDPNEIVFDELWEASWAQQRRKAACLDREVVLA
jgi:hypothetical protein